MDIENFYNSTKKQHGSSTANKILHILSGMFNYALKHGLCNQPFNPVQVIKRAKEEPEPRYIEEKERVKFFQSVVDYGTDIINDVILMSLFTGARQANVLSMRWSEIDFENHTWTIPREKTKSNNTIIIPLIPRAVALPLRIKIHIDQATLTLETIH